MAFSLSKLHATMALYGYEAVETPLIEPAVLFLTKAGDQLIERLFAFERSGQHFALRPEFTASAAYRYMRDYTGQQEVVRWQFSGPIFEDREPGAPRHHAQDWQYTSAGAELIGLAGSAADAEMIVMMMQGLRSQGLSDYRLVIGHVGLTRRLLKGFNLDDRTQRFLLNHRLHLHDPAQGKAYVIERLDQYLTTLHLHLENPAEISTEASGVLTDVIAGMMAGSIDQNGKRAMGGRTREDIARRLLEKQRRATQRSQILAALDFLETWGQIDGSPEVVLRAMETFIGQDAIARELLNEWWSTLRLLESCDLPLDRVQIKPDLARAWDYYTGIVFELHTPAGHVVAGGGRYDELIRLLGGTSTPAVGFACDVDLLSRVLTASSEAAGVARQVMLTGEPAAAFTWAQRLRERGIPAIWLPDTGNRSGPDVIAVRADGSLAIGAADYSVLSVEELMARLEINPS